MTLITVNLIGEILGSLNHCFSVKFGLACDLSCDEIIIFLKFDAFITVSFLRATATDRSINQVSFSFKFSDRHSLIRQEGGLILSATVRHVFQCQLVLSYWDFVQTNVVQQTEFFFVLIVVSAPDQYRL
jgi:hypothetical protein